MDTWSGTAPTSQQIARRSTFFEKPPSREAEEQEAAKLRGPGAARLCVAAPHDFPVLHLQVLHNYYYRGYEDAVLYLRRLE